MKSLSNWQYPSRAGVISPVEQEETKLADAADADDAE